MGSVTVTREAAPWRDRVRAYVVKLNGVKAGALMPGEHLTLPLAPGAHRIKLTIDWCSSPELSVDGAVHSALSCKAGGNSAIALIDALFRPGRYITLERDDVSRAS